MKSQIENEIDKKVIKYLRDTLKMIANESLWRNYCCDCNIHAVKLVENDELSMVDMAKNALTSTCTYDD